MSDWVPDEVVTGDILFRLPVRSLIRFRSVCKRWRSVIDSPEFIEHHTHDSAAATTTRDAEHIFLITRKGSHIYSIPYSSGSHQTTSQEIILPECHSPNWSGYEVVVCGSIHGLVCLADAYDDLICILNPATRERHVTRVPQQVEFETRCRNAGYSILWEPLSGCGFGYDSGSKEYKYVSVFCMVNEDLRRYKSEVMSFGIRSGSVQVVELPYWVQIKRSSGALVGEALLHWLFGRDSIIVAYDLGTNQYQEINPPPRREAGEFGLTLAVLRDCLCSCLCDEKWAVHVWMMKEYGVEASWSRMFSVPHSSFSSARWLVPLGLSVNGDEALLRMDGAGKLVWYDIEKERASQVMYSDDGKLVTVDKYIDRKYINRLKYKMGWMEGFEAIPCLGSSLVRPDGN